MKKNQINDIKINLKSIAILNKKNDLKVNIKYWDDVVQDIENTDDEEKLLIIAQNCFGLDSLSQILFK